VAKGRDIQSIFSTFINSFTMARHNKVKVLHVAEDDIDHLSDQWWEL